MIYIISSAKTMEFADSQLSGQGPIFIDKANQIAADIAEFPLKKLQKTLGVSDKLAELNYQRFQEFYSTNTNSPALCAYKGDVYQQLQVSLYNKSHFEFANSHVRIISGLYGILKALDIIKPYRLEMSSKLGTAYLNEFWKVDISNELAKELSHHKNKFIINLASNEYSYAINPKFWGSSLINVIFKVKKEGQYKIIGIEAKKARGAMLNFAIKNRINEISALKNFNELKYYFDESMSDPQNLVFVK